MMHDSWFYYFILFSWAPKSLWTVTVVMKLRCFLLGRKAMMNLDSVLKSEDITLPTNVHIVKIMVFPAAMYRCESWTIKKAGHQRTDTFELWCWRRLLRVPWASGRSNQSILKEINTGYSLEKLMLKFQYLASCRKEPTHWKRPWCWESLKAKREGVAEDEMVRKHHQFKGHEFEQTPGDSEGRGSLAWYSPWGHKESDMT